MPDQLSPCPDCGKRLSPAAETCPECGRRLKHVQTSGGILGAVVLGILLFVVIYAAMFS